MKKKQTSAQKSMHLRFPTPVLIATISIFNLADFGQAQAQQRWPVDPWTPGSPVTPTLPSRVATPNIAVSTTSWTFLGPAPLATGGANGNVSGRITGIAADPNDANIIYVATAGGGVWKTTNGGTSWVPLTDSFPSLSMGAIAVARSNPGVIYAATGEANNSGDSNHGQGILFSTDSGATWMLRTGLLGGTKSSVFSRRAIGKIAIDPTNANIAYAALGGFAENGLFGQTGIYKTTDGGVTWANVTGANGLDQNTAWTDVAIDSSNTNNIYASHGDINGVAANGVYKSTDGGTTWNLLSNAPNGVNTGRFAIALSRSNPLVLYVTVSSPNPNPAIFGSLSQIVRSDNGGTTFTDLTGGTPNYMGLQGWYDTTVIVDPTNSAIVYVGGAAGANSVLRSTNSGVSWSDISGGAVNPHADHHGADFDAAGVFLDGDDGGIYRLTNPAGPTWVNINGNLGTIQFQGIGLHPTNPNIALGGSQDNGTEVYTNSLLWTETDGGDAGFAKFNSTNGTDAYHQIPVKSFGPNFFRFSNNTGSTWVTRTTSIVADQNFQNFYAPFILDPSNGNDVWYGTRNVWVTGNEGANWIQGTIPGVNGWNPGGNNVTAMAQGNFGANFYAATGFNLFVTTNGVNWTDRTAGLSGFIQDIQVNPTNPATAYVAIASYNSHQNIFMTTNSGASWTCITNSGGFPDEPVFSVQLDAPNNIVYAGTERGVFFTNDNGLHWNRLGTGLPMAQVFQLEWNNTLKILGAGTHGRGLWELSIPTPPTPNIQVSGKGTIAVTGGQADFGLGVVTPVPPNTGHVVYYLDQINNFSINMTNVTSATLTGNHCHIVGTAQVNGNGPVANITVDTFHNPDQFFISSSTGYNAGGNLTSGSITD